MKAVQWFEKLAGGGSEVFNLSTGAPRSVKEMIAAMEAASGRPIPVEVLPRRAGDVAAVWGSADKAREVLGWEATKTVAHMCADAWRWQSQNPMGMVPEE